jgi:hypothetical protein
MPLSFVRIGSSAPHSWSALVDDWRGQTELLDEHFDEVEQLQSDILHPLVQRNDPRAGVFALHDGLQYRAICQINTAGIPGYDHPVMRVRHLTFAPVIDLGNDDTAYAEALIEIFWNVLTHCKSEGKMKASYLNFHLPSPQDRNFFTAIGLRFADRDLFESIDPKGAWLYITI